MSDHDDQPNDHPEIGDIETDNIEVDQTAITALDRSALHTRLLAVREELQSLAHRVRQLGEAFDELAVEDVGDRGEDACIRIVDHLAAASTALQAADGAFGEAAFEAGNLY